MPMFTNADVIHSYSRTDALHDGVLIDVSAVAREAGIRFPVALTAAVWAKCVAVPPGVESQDEAGRLWEVLWLLRCGVQRSAGSIGAVLPARPQQQPQRHPAAGAPQGRLRPWRPGRAGRHGHAAGRGLSDRL